MLSIRIKIQLAVFSVVATVAGSVMLFGYFDVPAAMFGVDRYTVTVQLPEAGGLYPDANVTYRGSTVGRVSEVRLTPVGVDAVLTLDSGISIPSDVDADVHSTSAVGEQYVALIPRSAQSPPLADDSVITVDRTSVPADVNTLLDQTNRGLQAIPRDNLKTAIDEAYVAIGGLGPELRRFVAGSTQLAIDGYANLDALTTVIDQSAPVLDSQSESAGSIQAWAANLAAATESLQTHDDDVTGVLQRGPEAAAQADELMRRLNPTLAIIAANMSSVADVAITYQPAIEQLLVLLPQNIASLAAGLVMNLNTGHDYGMLNFQLNINLPPPCTTGYLPASQVRSPALVDAPPRPEGDLYCRIPQDAPLNVRGVRNLPCLNNPGKRAPTVAMCESDEQYVPLNDGMNWKGDPNATLSGQDIPQLTPGAGAPPPAQAPPPATIATAQYDPTTGMYVGPDGHVYTQSELARDRGEQTWQSMLVPRSND